MMNEIVVRKATVEDAERIATIRMATWQFAYQNILPQSVFDNFDYTAELEKWKKLFIDNQSIHVSTVDEVVRAYCSIHAIRPDCVVGNYQVDGEIGAIYAEPCFEGRGLGSAMFDYARKVFREKKYKNFLVWCLKDNKIGKSFYINKQKGKIISERTRNIGGADVQEVAIVFNL